MDSNLSSMLNSFTTQIPALTAMVMMFCYIAGISFIFKGLMQFKKFGGQQYMNGQFEFKGPITTLAVGALLLYLPRTTSVTLASIFGGGLGDPFSGGAINFQNLGTGADLYGYVQDAGLGTQWQQLANTLVLVIQFVGLLSLVRGLFIMVKLGDGQSQQASFGKGLTHIIGGAVAMNFVGAATILANSLGIHS